ncbi:MAG: 2-amino-4-hydroxy-6-hydroxymethyldihydropteridine diphosphokinase [Sulfurospirillaceae bacterium]|nr:2-amino-4-hydroxy-6-hydroxymethyldihydropteridine diphosphokinase [Sulfurospirillaceae bacterium]
MRYKKIGENLAWAREPFFPLFAKTKVAYKHTAIVGVGGNEGDVLKRFSRLYVHFCRDRRVFVQESSAILKNPPFGFMEQNDFYNAVLVVKTSLSPKNLLKMLLHVETLFGRKRSFKNAPRTIDLDIIFFDAKRYKQKGLVIPHPCWSERLSVTLPLNTLKRFNKDWKR